jgi:peptidyl-dipeptidase Dcp
MSDKSTYNHALTDWNGPLGLPDFTACNACI